MWRKALEVEWQVTHNCPQCGARLVFHEKDRILKCDYCKVNSVIHYPDPMRYVLPYKFQGDDMIFVPYWRINGTIFVISQRNFIIRNLDTSRPAVDCIGLPLSLGFRPQAMTLSIHDTSLQRVLPHNIAFERVFEQVSKTLITGTEEKQKQASCIFISPMKSLIYQPFFRHGDSLIDAITGSVIRLGNNQNISSSATLSNWDVGFEACICPKCGWDLSVSSVSLVGICENCNTVIDLTHRELESIDKGFVSGEGQLCLPFWRIRCDIKGITLSSYGDLVRYLIISKVVSPAMNQKILYFWVPAFRVEPEALLRLAKQFTIAQLEVEYDFEMKKLKYLPITLNYEEAEGLVKVMIGSFGINIPNIGSMLKNLEVQTTEKKLIFVPFFATNSEFLYPPMNLSVLRTAIRPGA